MKISSGKCLAAAGFALLLTACGGGSSSDGVAANPPPAANTAPTIGNLASKLSVPQDSTSELVAFEVGDAESAPATIDVTVTSSDPQLIAPEAIVLAGNDTARSLRLMPVEGAAGTATITVTAADAQGMSTQQSVDVTVTSTQRSFIEMVDTAFAKQPESEAEETVGFGWVDNPEEDDTAFDHLFGQ
ncbi:MAG: hypothetical protein ACREXP_29465 [Steroidobacteraceae bacterium]